MRRAQGTLPLLILLGASLASAPLVARADDSIEDVVVRGPANRDPSLATRAMSVIRREDLDARLPRSSPDAMSWEPGVYVQQSAHGQGSPFVRGRTGQQVLVAFDGIRMNTSTWRQGPNQYFFTIDSRTIQSIDVVRGGASTRWGSDAIAGAIDAHPIEPEAKLDGLRVRPRASTRFASADSEAGWRLSVDAALTRDIAVLVGAGFRHAGLLEGGGQLRGANGEPALVPVLAADGRTQLGTGFDEVTADGRLVWTLGRQRRLVAATYVYRQYDSPRTDQCPSAYAPRSECLEYDEQFRTLAYVAYEGDLLDLAGKARVVASYQRQHERRTLRRPESFVRNGGRDGVDTFGLALKARSRLSRGAWGRFDLVWGADAYLDRVGSLAWSELTDVGAVIPLSRGLYVDGSSYVTSGAYTAAELTVGPVDVHGGARVAGAAARAPADSQSGTASVDRAWGAGAGEVRAAVHPTKWLTISAGWDRSFRAPNLDDLTSRQQSGPGFQFENPALLPEHANTFEAGIAVDHPRVQASLWGFHSRLDDAIARSFRTVADCPPQAPQCATSWGRYQLVNLSDTATLDGFELALRSWVTSALLLRATLSFAVGSGPNPQARPSDPTVPYAERVPLSRVPPLNGNVEVRWNAWQSAQSLFWVAASARFALTQDRLAPTDLADPRIPPGGTPGYAIFDARAGFRVGRRIAITAIFENVFDAAYRVAGSSVNGPGRGLVVGFESGL